MANDRTLRGMANSRWMMYVLVGVLAGMLVLLLSAQNQGPTGTLMRLPGNATELASLHTELASIHAEVTNSQQTIKEGVLLQEKAILDELETLQQAVKQLQHDAAWTRRFPGAVKSAKSSIMLLNNKPLCHIENDGETIDHQQPGTTKAAAARLDALAREHQREQDLFCRAFAAGEASPGGTPHNDTYKRLPAVAAVGNPDFTYPMWVHSGNDIVSIEIMNTGVWERAETSNILARLEEKKQASTLESDRVILLDVGANVGWYTVQAAAMGYQVIAVEPMPRNLGALRRTLCESPELASRVMIVPKGLSDKPRKCQLYVLRSNKGNGTPVCEGAAFANLKDSPEYELAGEFPLTTLDEAFNGTMEALAGRVQVVKIDVEGFEPQVYAGGRQFFDRVQPYYIMAELNQERNSATSPQTILHLYNDLGYAVHLSSFSGELLLPKNYDTLAQTQFAPPTINNIYMERLKSCSKL